MAVGLALAEAMLAARYNRPGHDLIDHRTFTIASDGDIQEGVASEACSLAGHLGLGKLTAFYDNNHIQLAGETGMAFSEDVGKRFEAYGWHVQDLGEDMELDDIEAAIDAAGEVADKPSLIMLRTHIGYGSPNKQDTQRGPRLAAGRGGGAAHQGGLRLGPRRPLPRPGRGARPLQRDRRRARRRRRGRVERARRGLPRRAPRRLGRAVAGDGRARLPDGWDADLPKFRPEDGRIATRKASQTVIQWAAARVPNLVSGSADLEPSTLTYIDDGGAVSQGRLLRAQRPLRRARARHGGDRQRAQPARPEGVRRRPSSRSPTT